MTAYSQQPFTPHSFGNYMTSDVIVILNIHSLSFFYHLLSVFSVKVHY